MTARPQPPAGLNAAGKRLWRGIVGDFDLDRREREILARACLLTDLADDMAKLAKREGTTVKGSTGQTRLHPAVGERRQALAVSGRLLGQLAEASRRYDE